MTEDVSGTDRGRRKSRVGHHQARPVGTPLPSGRADCAGLGAGMKVLTLDGAIPVEFLSPGDRVITRSGARILRGVSVRTVENGLIARIDPEAIATGETGAARGKLTLGADQAVLLRDWRAVAMFGSREAVAQLRRLADGRHIALRPGAGTRLYALAFDRDEVIYVEGLEVAVSAETTCTAVAA